MEWLTNLNNAIEYIRRRRMSQAAFELQRTDKKVVDIEVNPIPDGKTISGHSQVWIAIKKWRTRTKRFKYLY